MVVLALVVQDEAGTNIYLGHRSVVHPKLVFNLSQLVHAQLQRAGSRAEADRGALVIPGELAAYRTQYRRVHEAMVLAVTLASACLFDGSECLTNASQVLLSACRSQRSQIVTVAELLNKRDRLAEELEKCMYGEKSLGTKHGDGSRNHKEVFKEVCKDTEADTSLRQQLEEVDFSLPESLLSVARKQNVPPQTPSRKSGRDLRILTEDHFVPSLHMPSPSVGQPSQSSSHGEGEGHSQSETHTYPDVSDAHSEISWGSATTTAHAAGSGGAVPPQSADLGPSVLVGDHKGVSRSGEAGEGSEVGRSCSGSTAASELSYINASHINFPAEARQVDRHTGHTGSSASSDHNSTLGSPSQGPPPPTPPQVAVTETVQKSPEPEPEPELEPEPEPELSFVPTSPPTTCTSSQSVPRCQLKLVERVAAVLVNGQPTKFTISGQIVAVLGPHQDNGECARVSMQLWDAQNIAGETLQWGTAMSEDAAQEGVFHCDVPPQPSGGTAVLLSYKAIDSYRMVPLCVRAKWDEIKQEKIVTIEMRADTSLPHPLRNLRVGAQVGGTAPINRSIPADGSISLGSGRWLLGKVAMLQPGGSATMKIGFKGAAPDGTALELPQPVPIMVVFESVGTLSGLQIAASLRYNGSSVDMPVAASFEAMRKWYRCHDGDRVAA